MPPSSGPTIRRATALILPFLAALALLPAIASAAQPATLRLTGSDPEYRSTVLTTPAGKQITASPGLFRLRITPTGGAAVEQRGFCADSLHAITSGVNYNVSLRTAADEPLLASTPFGEAAWLIQQAESMVAAAPSGSQALEAGALQVAVWQLTDQVRGTNPTNDTTLNARAAAIRALASGRSVGGPVTIAAAAPHGCAGRSAVAIRLTGTPGSSATLSVAGGSGVVSPAQVRFDADGVAEASVTSATPGAVTVTARSQGGRLTRAARATSGASTPQETLFLAAAEFTASTVVTFDDCPVIPFETAPAVPVTPISGPLNPLETEGPTPSQGTPGPSSPHRSTQSSPTFTVTKRGPARAMAGSRVSYRIRVKNTSSAALGGLVLADDLPAGMSLARIPRRSALKSGRVVWRLSPLGAGRARTFTVRVTIDRGVSGRRCNRATVTRRGATTTRAAAKACTTIRSRPRTNMPAVTG